MSNYNTINRPHEPSAQPLDEADRDWLRHLTAREGERAACTIVGLTRNTFARAVAGLTVYAATRAVIRAARERSAR